MGQLLFNITHMFRGELILLWMFFCVLDGLYMKYTGYTNWLPCCFPGANMLFKCKLVGVNIAVSIFYFYFCFITLYSGWCYFSWLALCIRLIVDSKFAEYYLDCNKYIYTFVPFARYYFKIREIKNERA